MCFRLFAIERHFPGLFHGRRLFREEPVEALIDRLCKEADQHCGRERPLADRMDFAEKDESQERRNPGEHTRSFAIFIVPKDLGLVWQRQC